MLLRLVNGVLVDRIGPKRAGIISQVAVIGIPDEKWSERPLACVVLKPGASLTPDALREHLAGQFAKWQLPDAIEFVDAIPHGATGKISKKDLRDQFRDYKLADA